MKNLSIISIFIPAILVLGLDIYFSAQRLKTEEKQEVIVEEIQQPEPKEENQRNNITFILGADKEKDNPYYLHAENYYRQKNNDPVITQCRSLEAVKEFLEENAPINHLPWGNINLVVHSNEWNGLGVSVLDNSKERASIESIRMAIEMDFITPLSNTLLDRQSTLAIQACGLGNNRALLEEIALLFGGKDETRPVVKSSPYFVQYLSQNGQTEKYFTQPFYTYFKTGYRPADYVLAKDLKEAYPTEEIDWMAALGQKSPQFPGDIYHYYFNVPVEWMVTYEPDSMPIIATPKEQLAWLNNQVELQATLKKMNIDSEDFRWQFEETNYTFDDGFTEPAILAKGKVSILCVLKSFVVEDADHPMANRPFVPKENDTKFYAIVNP